LEKSNEGNVEEEDGDAEEETIKAKFRKLEE